MKFNKSSRSGTTTKEVKRRKSEMKLKNKLISKYNLLKNL